MRIRTIHIASAAAGAIVLATAATLWAAWPQFGRGIANQPGNQQHPVVATDGADGAIVAWQDQRQRAVNVFARRVLASGVMDAAWPVDGRALLTDAAALAGAEGGQNGIVIVPDGSGGAIVAWQDNRSRVTETDIYAQHVNGSGVVDGAWPANGAALCAVTGVQNTLVIASDGAGGAIAAWVDSRAGAFVFHIFAQHILNNGVVDPAWPVNGLAVCDAAGTRGAPDIVSDGAGGVIIAWQESRPGSAGFDIFALRVTNAGVRAPGWPLNGRAMCAASGDQGAPTITTDLAHGAVVAWSDSRVVGTSHVFAQHALASGVVDPTWPLDGRRISAISNIEGVPLAVSDGAGGAIVNWESLDFTLNMYAQHILAIGLIDRLWPAGGLALSDQKRQQTHAAIVEDGSGGAVVAWQDSSDIVATHVFATGTLDPTYPENGRAMCNLISDQGEPTIVATSGAGAIVAWKDARNGVDPDVFALQVLAAAPTSVPDSTPPGVSFAPAFPNPARGSLAIRFVLSRETPVQLSVYDVTGRRVRVLISGERRGAGEHVLQWNMQDDRGRNVSAGVYFARLEASQRAVTQKLVKLK